MGYPEVSARFRVLSEGVHGKGASAEETEQAGGELGVLLPESYKAFLGEFGWGSFAHWEVHGLGSDDVPPYLDVVRVTLDERRDLLLPSHLVVILNDGGGGLHCLDTSSLVAGEGPVVFWDHEEGKDQLPAPEANGFLSWLSERMDLIEG